MDITGRKVILRAADMQDRAMLQDLIQDPEVMKVTGGYGGTASRLQWRSRVRPFLAPDTPGSLRRVIADREIPETGLGIIMLTRMDSGQGTAEIYIKLAGPFRGRGYGRDTINTIIAYAFRELGLKQICSRVLEYNTASQRLFEACGFQQEKIHKGGTDGDGRCRTVYSYVITKQDFEKKEKSICRQF